METQETLTRRIHADFRTIPEVVVAQCLAPAADFINARCAGYPLKTARRVVWQDPV